MTNDDAGKKAKIEAAFGAPPAICPQCSHAWHGGMPHRSMNWCPICRDAGKRCPIDLGAKPEPTSDPGLSLGSVQLAYEYPTSTETVDLVCALCGRSDSERVLLLFAPLLVWQDGDSYHHNTGICRDCTARAVRVWAEAPEGFSALLPAKPSEAPAAPPPQYPEHEKLRAVAEKSQACGAFLEQLLETYTLAKYHKHDESCAPSQIGYARITCGSHEDVLYPETTSTNRLLAAFFEIDEAKLEAEKVQMLAEMRLLAHRQNNSQ